VNDDTQAKRGQIISFVKTESQTFGAAVLDQQLARDFAKDRAQWPQEISQSSYASEFPTFAAAVMKQGLPPSLFRGLCQSLLDNDWIAEAIAEDIQNLAPRQMDWRSTTANRPTSSQLSILIDNHQASLAEVDIAIEQDPSEGSERLQAAFEKEQIALGQLLEYSPRNLGEVNFKSSYFLERSDFLGCEDPRMLMFLRAMVQVA
jgi:hypothetical protein